MRTGVLSDQAIKERAPEFFPLDIGNQEFTWINIFSKELKEQKNTEQQ
jgi:hypothetical protein